MNSFSYSRFQRLLLNDLLRIAKPVLMMSGALLCLTSIIYVAQFDPGHVTNDPPIGVILFGVYLLAGGLLLTSEIFRDMHHSLDRYHYLMLPVSNLERFLSRYLLTGPLLILYMLVAFSLIDWTANGLAAWAKGASDPHFSALAGSTWLLARIYLLAHALGFLGAICFRSMNLLKTILSLAVVWISVMAAVYLALRVFFFDAFTWGKFEAVKPLRLSVMPLFEGYWPNVAVVTGFGLWLLYVAYRCLKAHEVQNGL